MPLYGVYGPDRSARDPLKISEAVVDTGAEVTLLGAEVYNRIQLKPPVRRHVTMLQAGDGARLKGFIAGPFMSRQCRALAGGSVRSTPEGF